LEKQFEKKYGRNEKSMVASAARHIKILEKHNFKNIIVSLKASDIDTTVKACRLFSKKFIYPQHLGITEAGTERSGSIKSAIGLGILLHEGIGDTIRVSLSADPVKEIPVAINILKHLKLRKGLNVVSCPMCSRAGIDTEIYATQVENALGHIKTEKTVAVMGCVVNGPGEAKDADIAIVGTKGKHVFVYKKDKYIKKIDPKDIVKTFRKYLNNENNIS
jgi:(E)-4-hydroxy-3-methylbut-2-enyl-diphosphate synthase